MSYQCHVDTCIADYSFSLNCQLVMFHVRFISKLKRNYTSCTWATTNFDKFWYPIRKSSTIFVKYIKSLNLSVKYIVHPCTTIEF